MKIFQTDFWNLKMNLIEHLTFMNKLLRIK